MAFTLTKYIYPIEQQVILSEILGYSIDNPRTEWEIEQVESHISISLAEKTEHMFVDDLMDCFKTLTRKLFDHSEYATLHFDQVTAENVHRKLAEAWVIVRYENEEIDEILKKEKALDMYMAPRTKPHLINDYNQLLNYFHLLELFVSREVFSFVQSTLIMFDMPFDIFFKQKGKSEVIEVLHSFLIYVATGDTSVLALEEIGTAIDEMTVISKQLEAKFNQDKEKPVVIVKNKHKDQKEELSHRDKLFFVGEILRIANDADNDRVKLLLLASILEFLITRNPETTRFNVEDSITRQFVLKTAVLLYRCDEKLNLTETKKQLKDIYQLRSDIAHGNKPTIKSPNAVFAAATKTLYGYVKVVVSEYLRDSDYVNFLKSS